MMRGGLSRSGRRRRRTRGVGAVGAADDKDPRMHRRRQRSVDAGGDELRQRRVLPAAVGGEADPSGAGLLDDPGRLTPSRVLRTLDGELAAR